MNDHPLSDELIGAYLDGESSADERRQVEDALAASDELAQTVAELAALGRELRELPRHTLDAGFAARVLAQAEREMLASTGAPPRAADPASAPLPTIGQPAPDAPRATRAPRNWRTLVWAVVATAGALLLYVNEKWLKDPPDVRVATRSRTGAESLEDNDAGASPDARRVGKKAATDEIRADGDKDRAHATRSAKEIPELAADREADGEFRVKSTAELERAAPRSDGGSNLAKSKAGAQRTLEKESDLAPEGEPRRTKRSTLPADEPSDAPFDAPSDAPAAPPEHVADKSADGKPLGGRSRDEARGAWAGKGAGDAAPGVQRAVVPGASGLEPADVEVSLATAVVSPAARRELFAALAREQVDVVETRRAQIARRAQPRDRARGGAMSHGDVEVLDIEGTPAQVEAILAALQESGAAVSLVRVQLPLGQLPAEPGPPDGMILGGPPDAGQQGVGTTVDLAKRRKADQAPRAPTSPEPAPDAGARAPAKQKRADQAKAEVLEDKEGAMPPRATEPRPPEPDDPPPARSAATAEPKVPVDEKKAEGGLPPPAAAAKKPAKKLAKKPAEAPPAAQPAEDRGSRAARQAPEVARPSAPGDREGPRDAGGASGARGVARRLEAQTLPPTGGDELRMAKPNSQDTFRAAPRSTTGKGDDQVEPDDAVGDAEKTDVPHGRGGGGAAPEERIRIVLFLHPAPREATRLAAPDDAKPEVKPAAPAPKP